MRIPLQHLAQVQALKRHKAHPLLHRIHQKHKISRKTLFYIKEYGPHSNVARTIIKESAMILLLASSISSLGGLALENIKDVFLTITPFIILMPVLNDMIGDYGTIISSRVSAMLHEGRLRSQWHESPELKHLFLQVFLIATLTAFVSAVMALIISRWQDPAVSLLLGAKILAITLLDVMLLVTILFVVAVIAGLQVYRKNEDPNNFLIPITTSVADFGNMLIVSVLIRVFF